MDQAEGLRNIIKKQEIDSAKRTARVITVTSGKGGVGKTSVSVNLAIQLSRLGRKVIVLDADFGLANIEIMLGIRPKYNLSDLMFRGKAMKDIITYGPEGIGFVSGGSGINEMANLTREQVFQLIQKMEELDRIADIIIVDTGAGIGDSVLEFVAASEEVLLVTTPEPTSITDGYALLKTLNRNSSYRPGKTAVKMIANQVRSGADADELFDKVGLIVNKFLNIEVEYLGGIPYDSNMQKAIMRQEPLSMAAPGAPAARSLARIAGRLENQEEQKSRYGIVQLFSSVIKMKFQRRY
jgi:flagellar biosynthesis protein FlhG